MNFICPVCYFDHLHEPPRNYNICPCCGTEFGNDDDGVSWKTLRDEWLANGAHWFFEQPPIYWNPYGQLLRANVPLDNLAWAVPAGRSLPTRNNIMGQQHGYFTKLPQVTQVA